jgi:hypothetical protein
MKRQDFAAGAHIEKDDGPFSQSSHHIVREGDLITMYGHTFLVTQTNLTQSLGGIGMAMQLNLELNAVEINSFITQKTF